MHLRVQLLLFAVVILAGPTPTAISQEADKPHSSAGVLCMPTRSTAVSAARQADDGRPRQRSRADKPRQKRPGRRRAGPEGAFLPKPEGVWPIASLIVARPGATTIDVNVLAAQTIRGRIE